MQRPVNHIHALQQTWREWLSAQLLLAPFQTWSQRHNCLPQPADNASSSYLSMPDRGGEAKFLCAETSNKGLETNLSRYLDVPPCLSFHDRLQRALLYCWCSEPCTHHIQDHGRKRQWESGGPGEWQALPTTCDSDKTKVPQSSCISSSVQEHKDYISGTENKPYSLFLMLTNCNEVMS